MADHDQKKRSNPPPEDWGMPKMREPDFSDVRKHIRRPKAIIIFIIISVLFWLAYYLLFPGCGPKSFSPATEKIYQVINQESPDKK